jgi:hypothetical protein
MNIFELSETLLQMFSVLSKSVDFQIERDGLQRFVMGGQ